jgi:hypothetical protein
MEALVWSLFVCAELELLGKKNEGSLIRQRIQWGLAKISILQSSLLTCAHVRVKGCSLVSQVTVDRLAAALEVAIKSQPCQKNQCMPLNILTHDRSMQC